MAKKFVDQAYMAATGGKGLRHRSKRKRILIRILATCSAVIALASILIVTFCITFQMCPIIGTSMMTTLNPTGDNTDKALTCILGEPSRNDIIVTKLYARDLRYRDYFLAVQGDANALERLRQIHDNTNYSQQDADVIAKRVKVEYDKSDRHGEYRLIVKRLIGKGGDQISMRRIDNNYYIYLNGEKLDESYLDPLVATHNAYNFVQLWNVLNGNVWRRSRVTDKAPADKADLTDWVGTKYESMRTENPDTAADGNGEPSTYMLTVPKGYYFVMGDNRGSAYDEYNRSWDSTYFGPVPAYGLYGYCVDVVDRDINMPQYIWNQVVYYLGFGWAWRK